MKVSIIENNSGMVVNSYEINLGTLDHSPTDEEYYSQAWLRAIEEGIVEESDYPEYSFSL